VVNQKVLVQIKSMNGIKGATELNGKNCRAGFRRQQQACKDNPSYRHAGGGVSDISVRRNSLEDVSVSLTGGAFRE
jgi:hypothetical protein